VKLTFHRFVVVADADFVNAALCRHVLDRYGPVLVRLESRLRASCGRHHDRLIELKAACPSWSTGT